MRAGSETHTLTYLGHAGFCVETPAATILMDPWLSPDGAFDASWFQLPSNHHLAETVQAMLERDVPSKFVYVSHEHADHFDLAFLESLRERGFELIVPRYRRSEMRRALAAYRCKALRAVNDGERIAFTGGYLTVYVDDSELNRDSAIVIKTGAFAFLNLNDCRIFDRLREIQENDGPLDVIAGQYSGASWHPTCYAYDEAAFTEIARRKVLAKFSTVARTIETARPKLFIPSAGPPAFLDPQLIELNFRAAELFPRGARLAHYLAPVLERTKTSVADLMPGDEIDLTTFAASAHSAWRLTDENFEPYVREYAQRYEAYFAAKAKPANGIDLEELFGRLRKELELKLSVLSLAARVEVPLYFGIDELPERWLAIDFQARTIEETDARVTEPYYRISASAVTLDSVLSRRVTWEEFGLGLRARIDRKPDVYRPLLHAFLTLDAGEIVRFCKMTVDLESRADRIDVDAGERSFSVLRYCPHNGGDLAEATVEDGRYLMCPRHKWRFDLLDGGRCTTSEASISAMEAARLGGVP